MDTITRPRGDTALAMLPVLARLKRTPLVPDDLTSYTFADWWYGDGAEGYSMSGGEKALGQFLIHLWNGAPCDLGELRSRMDEECWGLVLDALHMAQPVPITVERLRREAIVLSGRLSDLVDAMSIDDPAFSRVHLADWHLGQAKRDLYDAELAGIEVAS